MAVSFAGDFENGMGPFLRGAGLPVPADLKNIEFQIVGRVVPAPEDGVIRRLGAVFDLAQAPARTDSGLADGFCEQLWRHKVGAGAGGQKAFVPDEL